MNGGEQLFVRNNRGSAPLDDADASNLDLLIVVGSRFAILNFKVCFFEGFFPFFFQPQSERRSWNCNDGSGRIR
jgi:hypothetical protein